MYYFKQSNSMQTNFLVQTDYNFQNYSQNSNKFPHREQLRSAN